MVIKFLPGKNSAMLVEPGTDNNSTENCDESLPDELITILVM